jgi:hypothetical protein
LVLCRHLTNPVRDQRSIGGGEPKTAACLSVTDR